MPTGKVCTKCNKDKPLEDFYKKSDRTDGHAAQCKLCTIKQVSEYRANNPDKVDTWRRNHQIRNYGLTLEDHSNLVEVQGGVCAICKQPETAVDTRYGKLRDLCIDHDHRTGAPRGLLCSQCNVALGNFKDDLGILRSAISYLQEWSCRLPAV